MQHSRRIQPFYFLPTRIVQALSTALLVGLINACATGNSGPAFNELPTVDADSAATITFRSKNNFSDTKHRHQLYIDGLLVARFKEEDVQAFTVAEGKHSLKLTCHSRNIRGSTKLPFNYNVVDGDEKMDIEVLAGDSICLKIGFGPLDCAKLSETGPSYCE